MFGNKCTCIYCVLYCLYCVFRIVSFMYIYSNLFRLYYCMDYCHRVTTQLQLITIIIIILIIIITIAYIYFLWQFIIILRESLFYVQIYYISCNCTSLTKKSINKKIVYSHIWSNRPILSEENNTKLILRP